MNPAPAHSKTTSTQRPRRSPVRIAISTLLWAVTACVVVIMAARFAPSALSNGRLIPEAAAFIPWLALLSVLILIIAALTRRKVLSAVTVLCLVCQIFLPAPRIAEEAVEAVPEQTTPRDTVMRVMTLNTKNGNADAEQIVSIVRDQHVEVLAMQEVSGSLIERLSAAGLVNITGDGSKGVIISGLTGIGGDNNSGVMISGLMNVTGNMASGFQFSGVSNITGQSFNGMMTSGLLNVVGENMNGLQIAGIANITAKDLNGAQIGLCNYATKAHGFQIGVVNYYREDMKGLQLGLVNANPDTRIQMMVYGGNVTPANIGVRFKNQLFYTILGVGAFDQNLNDKFSISTSYRAGLAVPVYKGLSISGDLGFQHIETCSNKDEVIPRRLYGLQARANLEYQISKKFGIFATGGYGLTRYYNKSGNFDKGAIIEAGIVLF